ncbi:Glucose-responsive transcription factor [Microsporum ferrugineum]
MNSREHSEMPPAPSYPSPNATQIAQGTVSYYANQRHLTADELHLSAELSREVAGANVNDGSAASVAAAATAAAAAANGLPHSQGIVLGSSGPNADRAVAVDQQQVQQQQQRQQQQQDHQVPQPSQGQQHMLQFPSTQQSGVDPNHDLSYGDQSARRKRSKVSRACDECRRKKVRCDATSEAGVETCSNCRRTGATCEFSRVPMKRGPSKGYIKELADRINSLETQMQPPLQPGEMHYQQMNEDGSAARGYQDFSPSMDNQGLTRKRTLSMSEGLPNAFMQAPFIQGARPTSVGGWPAQTPTKDATHAADLAALEEYPNSSAQNGNAKVMQPFWTQELPDSAQQPAINPEKLESLPPPVEVDEQVLNAYYRHIHPIFPILPTSRDLLSQYLKSASRQIQESFLHSLFAVTGANLSRAENLLQEIPAFQKAQDYLTETLREDPRTRPQAVNFVLLFTFMLLIIDADSRGPENIQGQNGINKTVLVDAAFPIAHHLARSYEQIDSCNVNDRDVDSDGNLARKNWTVLMILARWHTLSVAGRDVFGVCETATPEDRGIFSFASLQLARYSTSISEINEVFFDNSVHPSFGRMNSHSVRRLLYGQLKRLKDIESWHETTEDNEMSTLYSESICPLLFWSLTLILKRQLYTSVPAEVLYPAEVILELLQQHSDPAKFIASPFHHHAMALAVMTLLEVTDLPELTTDAWISLDKALHILNQREKHASTADEFGNIFANRSWGECFRAMIEVKVASFRPNQQGGGPVGPNEQRSLEHLADLAVGAGGAAAVAGGSSEAQATRAGATATEDATSSSQANVAADASTGQKDKADLRVYVDFTQLTKRGYLNVFAGL